MKIKNPLDINFNKLLSQKKITIPLSVFISFVIWISVIINQNPVRDQVFTDIPATISVENTVLSDMGIGIVSDISSQKFTVKISGPNYVVSSVRPEDFLLSASVTDVTTAGTYTLDIVGNANSSKTGYTFSSIDPPTMDVTFDYIDTKEFPVTPKILEVKAADGLVADTPVVADTLNNTITIKGPRTIMDTVKSVSAVATANATLETTTSYNADIVLYNEKEEVIYRFAADNTIYNSKDEIVETTPLTLSFTTVKVSQPILKRATLKVLPVFTNLPDGITVDDIKYTLSTGTVTAMGTPEVIEKISELSLSAIDFRSVSTTSNSFEVSAVLPDGVKLIDNIEFFTVSIDTSNYIEKAFTVSDFKYNGLGSALTVKSSNKIRNVKLCGPRSVINSIVDTELYGLADLTDKAAGEYTVEVTVKSNKNDKFWQVGVYSTTVRLADK